MVGIKAAAGIVLAADGYQRNGQQVYDTPSRKPLRSLQQLPASRSRLFLISCLSAARVFPASTLCGIAYAVLPACSRRWRGLRWRAATTLGNVLEHAWDGAALARGAANMRCRSAVSIARKPMATCTTRPFRRADAAGGPEAQAGVLRSGMATCAVYRDRPATLSVPIR